MRLFFLLTNLHEENFALCHLIIIVDIKNPDAAVRVLMWYLQESNQGHKDFQSFALPTELRYQPIFGLQRYTIFHFFKILLAFI